MKKEFKNLKIALVHDFLLYPGGAEKVLKSLSEIFPEAPIYTLLYDEKNMKGMFADKKIHTSFLQKFPQFLRKHHRYLLPFYASAVETYNLRDFDLIVSSSGAWSKGIVTRVDTKHIAYIHSPMRFIWDENERYLRRNSGLKSNFIVRQILSYLRIWDFQASKRPDFLISNSKYTQTRISKYYRRDSEVIYPPVELVDKLNNNIENVGVSHWQTQNSQIKENYSKLNEIASSSAPLLPRNDENGVNNKQDSRLHGNDKEVSLNNFKTEKPFVIISRLSVYKNVKLVVEAFKKLDLPLIVIGDGEEREKLEKMATAKIQILGWVDDERRNEILGNSRAFIFPVEDDFGIVCVEALSFGLPVIALRKGGAVEIVKEGITGEFFDTPTIEVLADGVRRFLENEKSYDKQKIKESAKKFSEKIFKERILSFIEEKLK